MRPLFMMFLLASTATPAIANDPQEVLNTLGFRLTTAYQCAPVLNDVGPYEREVAALSDNLARAGITEPTADEIIRSVEAEPREDSPLTVQLCRSLLGLSG